MSAIKFHIEKRLVNKLGRAGLLTTPHGAIQTPAFVTVGTKATVKALTPAHIKELGAQVVLANTYHLYLQPGHERVAKGGGLHGFMGWSGSTMTDSGGFQAFSLGAGFGNKVGKVATKGEVGKEEVVAGTESEQPSSSAYAKVTEDGVTFKSVIDGSTHHFTPERSMEIQHALGADMIFAFDECTSPYAPYDYQKAALDRTHRWATRCVDFHNNAKKMRDGKESAVRDHQALFGIVQGGRFQDLREESARVIGAMDFDGFGIGGSFEKEDMDTAVGWVNALLPEDKPRHLLGIGEPGDIFGAVEQGCDLFDCVAPTRIARNGTLYTHDGLLNIMNARYVDEYVPIEEGCTCYTCRTFTRAYLAHLFRAHELLAHTLASIHNLHFILRLVERMRQAILDGGGAFEQLREGFCKRYYRN